MKTNNANNASITEKRGGNITFLFVFPKWKHGATGKTI